jgi:hypothetical protein
MVSDMSNQSPCQLLPHEIWISFLETLSDVANTSIDSQKDVFFDSLEPISETQKKALQAILLKDMEFKDNGNSATFDIGNGIHSIAFSNRIATKGELRGDNLKSCLKKLSKHNPGWTLEKALIFISSSIDSSDLFAYFMASLSSPSFYLDPKYKGILKDYGAFCLNKMNKRQILGVSQVQCSFDLYYHTHNKITKEIIALERATSVEIDLIKFHLGAFISTLFDAIEEGNKKLQPLLEILDSWGRDIDYYLADELLREDFVKNVNRYHGQLRLFLTEGDLNFSQAVTQLFQLSMSLKESKTFLNWNEGVIAYLRGDMMSSQIISLSELSSINVQSIVQDKPYFKKSVKQLLSLLNSSPLFCHYPHRDFGTLLFFKKAIETMPSKSMAMEIEVSKATAMRGPQRD